MRPIAALSILPFVGACALHPPTRSGSLHPEEQTPTERYESYRAALERAEALEELLPLTSEAVREEIAKRPGSYRKALLADLQVHKADWLRVTDEQVDGKTASLEVEGVQIVDPAKGTRGYGKGKVILLREADGWHVDDEIWSIEGEDSTGIQPRDWAATTTPIRAPDFSAPR